MYSETISTWTELQYMLANRITCNAEFSGPPEELFQDIRQRASHLNLIGLEVVKATEGPTEKYLSYSSYSGLVTIRFAPLSNSEASKWLTQN